jgi:2-amino-4-hydroxy-6-hydroxymethyldihydropteridine diphosphokinase
MILVALGANLAGPAGSPRAQLEAALAALADHGVAVRARSRWWRSDAWPDPGDPPFVNAVAEVATALAPEELLAALHAIEAQLGRRRSAPNAARPIDLDLLDYDGMVRHSGVGPLLPHPRLAERRFVLLPLAELVPEWRHPVSGLGVGALIAALPPGGGVEPLERAGD